MKRGLDMTNQMKKRGLSRKLPFFLNLTEFNVARTQSFDFGVRPASAIRFLTPDIDQSLSTSRPQSILESSFVLLSY